MENKLAVEKITRWAKMKSERATTESYWQDVADYMLPSREVTFLDQVAGRRKQGKIFDTTGIWALEQLAGGLHSMLTSSATKWFMLRADSTAPIDEKGALWLNDVSRIMHDVFNSPKSQFNSNAHELYLELCGFGNGVMYVDKRKANNIFFKTYSIANCCYMENEEGKVDLLYRVTHTTAKQVLEQWPDTAHEKVKEVAEKEPNKLIRILHAVEPRPAGKKGSYKTNKPWSSCYVDMENQHIMEEGGYDTFPYLCPRFSKRTNEVYGFGPGMSALADVRMINRMHEVIIRGMEKIVDPPILLPHEAMIRPLTLQPAGLNFYDPSAGGEIKPLVTNGRPEIGLQYLAQQQEKIVKHFYVDWMNLPQGGNMTATEVMQRRDEKLRLLSPMVSRLQTEFLGALIDRVFYLLLEIGAIPKPPESLFNKDVKIEYISPIAQAQRFAELDSLTRSIGFAAQLAEIDPMVMRNFDIDAAVRWATVEINNVQAKLLTPLEQVKAEREQQAAANQQNQQAMLANEQSSANKQQATAIKTMREAEAI